MSDKALDDTLHVTDNEVTHQYEAWLDGELARLEYRRTGDRIVFTHTEVPSTIERRGIGSELVRVALDDAKAQGLQVVPVCPFVRAYIQRHPEYQRLLASHGSAGR
jgi:predicted GNAT family acetyltransferase